MIRLTWDLPAEAWNVRLCRNLVREVLVHLQVHPEEVDEIELAIGELCGNVVRHAELAPGSSFVVELEARETTVFITVTDTGVGFEPSIAGQPMPTDSGGLGLWIVGQLTDRLEFEKANDHGTIVRAVRHLRRALVPSHGMADAAIPGERPEGHEGMNSLANRG